MGQDDSHYPLLQTPMAREVELEPKNKNQTEGKPKVVAAGWGTELKAAQPIIPTMI